MFLSRIVVSVLTALAIVLSSALPPARFDHAHAAWTEVLGEHVRGDGFDYRELKSDPAGLDHYLASLETVMPEEFASWKRAQQHAFWINAYNAYTVRAVLSAYPIESVKDVKDGEGNDFWHQATVPLGRLHPEAAGRPLTLDEVEHAILRPAFRDARVHAAINCASRGCPPLLDEAFTAGDLERQLDGRVEAWLGDPRRNRFDPQGQRLHLSRLFEWFQDDFVREAGSVRAWIAARAPEPEREWIAASDDLVIEYLDYDWKLNDAP